MTTNFGQVVPSIHSLQLFIYIFPVMSKHELQAVFHFHTPAVISIPRTPMHDGSINNMLKCQCSKKPFQHVESQKKKRKRAIEHAISWTAATTLTEGVGIKHPNLQLFDSLLYYLIISAPMATLQYTWILQEPRNTKRGKKKSIQTLHILDITFLTSNSHSWA